MKQTFLTLLFVATILTTSAQNPLVLSKVYHNEIGVNVTGTIFQLLSSQQRLEAFVNPTYYLTYRRLFKPGNIRIAVGGSLKEREVLARFPEDRNKYYDKSYHLVYRIGWEFYSDLSNRWQVFYGLDFRTVFVYQKNDAYSQNTLFARGRESNSQSYGVAPILGFRLFISKRLSISTEASFFFNYSQSYSRRFFTPIIVGLPPLPDIEDPKTRSFYTTFSSPASVYLTFDL